MGNLPQCMASVTGYVKINLVSVAEQNALYVKMEGIDFHAHTLAVVSF